VYLCGFSIVSQDLHFVLKACNIITCLIILFFFYFPCNFIRNELCLNYRIICHLNSCFVQAYYIPAARNNRAIGKQDHFSFYLVNVSKYAHLISPPPPPPPPSSKWTFFKFPHQNSLCIPSLTQPSHVPSLQPIVTS